MSYPYYKTLDQIGIEQGTDKASSFHDYLVRLEPFFKPLNNDVITLVEIGIDGGASVRMWAEYFHNGTVIGIDCNPQSWQPTIEHPHIKRIVGDACLPATWREVPNAVNIIVDDGSHIPSHVISTFSIGWPKLKSGGLYVIEDLHVAYSAHYNSGQAKSSLGFLTTMLDDLNHRGAGMCGKRNEKICDVDFICFSKSLALLRKL